MKPQDCLNGLVDTIGISCWTTQEKSEEKKTGTNCGDFSSLEEIYHENVTKFQLKPESLLGKGREND